MTAISARLPFAHVARVSPFARLAARRRTLPRPPAFIVVCATVTVLNIVGLVMILSASSVAALSDYGSSWYFFNRQLLWAIVGALAFVFAARLDYRRWRSAAPVLLIVTLGLLAAVLKPGIGIYVEGSRRWLGAGPLRVQPSELAKLTLVVVCAAILARRADTLRDARAWRPVLVVLGVIGFFVYQEPDLDTAVVLALIAFAILIVGGVPLRQVAKIGGFGLLAVTFLAYAAPYRRARMFSFLHPGADVANTGYQLKQSLIALGSGGWNGVGIGAGHAKWLFLPNAHTDFIFSIIGEETGFVGCLLVLGLFAGLGLVGFYVARRAPDQFGALLAAGITVWIVGQAAINLGAVVGLLPVSGITLPFISAGGSSLVITMLATGTLANVARQSLPRPAAPATAKSPARTRRRSS
jgi:cell division protein FtsW